MEIIGIARASLLVHALVCVVEFCSKKRGSKEKITDSETSERKETKEVRKRKGLQRAINKFKTLGIVI